jgi:hypothetical protein
MPATRRPLAASLAALAASAALLLGLAAPVSAMAPTTVEEQFTRVLNNHCPDFAIRSTFFVDRRVTTYYDADGTPIRRLIVGNFPGEVQNVATGYTLPAHNVRIISIDLLTGEQRSTGTNVRVYEPNGGTIQLTAGIQVFDASGALIFSGGRLDLPPTPELCAALAAG